jgi:hypothetical protein
LLPQSTEPAYAGRRGWIGSLAAFLVLAAVAALASAVFWPGNMNLDTLDEFRQAQSSHYTDWHAPVLSAMWHLLMLAGLRSPGWVLAGGVLTLLVGLYLLLRVRLSQPWAVLAAVLVFVFPPILSFDVELGTDAWFASAILCGFGFAARCARTQGGSRIVSAVLAVSCAFVAQAARPTAAPAVLALLCAVGLVTLATRLDGWQRMLGTAAVGIIGTALIFGSVLGLQRFALHATELHAEQNTYEYDLVAMSIRTHQVLLPPDVYPRQDVAYLEEFSSASTVVDISPLLWGPHAVIPIPMEGTKLHSVQHAWLSAIRQHPYEYLRERLHTALWQLTIEGVPEIVFYGAAFPAQPPGSGFSLAFPALHSTVMAYVSVGSKSDGTVGGPLQRVWVYVFVLLVGAGISLRTWRRRHTDAVLALLSAALLMYTAEILLVGPGVGYRYMYPVVATGTVLFVILASGAGRWLRDNLRRL